MTERTICQNDLSKYFLWLENYVSESVLIYVDNFCFRMFFLEGSIYPCHSWQIILCHTKFCMYFNDIWNGWRGFWQPFDQWVDRFVLRHCSMLALLHCSGTQSKIFIYFFIYNFNDILSKKVQGTGWLRLVGSIKLQVSCTEYSLFYRALLQQRPLNLSILLTEATPYHLSMASRTKEYPFIHLSLFTCILFDVSIISFGFRYYSSISLRMK